MPDGEYAVQIDRWVLEYSKFHGMEYREFALWAFQHDIDPVGVPKTDLLYNPIEKSLIITTPGQWAIALIIEASTSDEEAMSLLKKFDASNKGGRPRKVYAVNEPVA
jgi:hypothetical protein